MSSKSNKDVFKITITVDTKQRKVFIEDSHGNSFEMKGIAIHSGSSDTNQPYILLYGNHEEVAWAFGKGYDYALIYKDKVYLSFYKRCAQEMAQRHMDEFTKGRPLSLEDLDELQEEEEKLCKVNTFLLCVNCGRCKLIQ